MSDTLYDYKKRIDPAYSPPSHFEHAKWEQVGEFKHDGGDDGQDVKVFEERWPTSFWAIRAYATPNSAGELSKEFVLKFGSGDEMGKLAFLLARQISFGMIALATECNIESTN